MKQRPHQGHSTWSALQPTHLVARGMDGVENLRDRHLRICSIQLLRLCEGVRFQCGLPPSGRRLPLRTLRPQPWALEVRVFGCAGLC